jgi:Phage integrase, N-terminal SAM-like domain
MSSIETRRRNGKITYRAHYRDPGGKLRSRSFARKTDARAFLTTIDGAKLRGTFIDPSRSRITSGELADEWLAGKVNLKPTTRALYTSVIETHIRPRWGSVSIGKVAHGDVQRWVADLVASGLSGGHVHKVPRLPLGTVGWRWNPGNHWPLRRLPRWPAWATVDRVVAPVLPRQDQTQAG